MIAPISCRSKVVATVGPSSSSAEQIRGLIASGVDVFRLNLSHGDHDEHRTVHRIIREETASCGRAIAIIADLQGPKIRVGPMPEGGALLVEGEPLHSPPKALSLRGTPQGLGLTRPRSLTTSASDTRSSWMMVG